MYHREIKYNLYTCRIMAIKAFLNCRCIDLCTGVFSLLSLVFWVTLPCAVHLIPCAPTNGGKLMKTDYCYVELILCQCCQCPAGAWLLSLDFSLIFISAFTSCGSWLFVQGKNTHPTLSTPGILLSLDISVYIIPCYCQCKKN